MDTGVGDLVAANKLVVGIDSDMVLVAKNALPFFFVQRASVSFCRRFCFDQDEMVLPALISSFLPAVALDGNANDTGINDLAFLGAKPVITEELIELSEQQLNHVGTGQFVAEAEDGGSIWNLRPFTDSKKTGEGVTNRGSGTPSLRRRDYRAIGE